jgi:hypothetical protein
MKRKQQGVSKPRKPTARRDSKRLRIGDVFEVPLARGFAYIQLVHHDAKGCGDLVRVLAGIHRKRLDISTLASQEEIYCAFFPVRHIAKRSLVRRVGSAPVDPKWKRLPNFKGYNQNFATGRRTWFIIDAKNRFGRKVAKLNKEQEAYPMHHVVGFPLMVERIESGWMPQDEAK